MINLVVNWNVIGRLYFIDKNQTNKKESLTSFDVECCFRAYVLGITSCLYVKFQFVLTTKLQHSGPPPQHRELSRGLVAQGVSSTAHAPHTGGE